MAKDAVIEAVKQLGTVLLNVLLAQFLGYLCLLPSGPQKTTVMSPQAVSGLGAFAGLVSLPAILYRAVAVLDFSTVDPTVVERMVRSIVVPKPEDASYGRPRGTPADARDWRRV